MNPVVVTPEMAIALTLKAERAAAGLSRRQLEEITKISESSIRRYEAGTRSPSVREIDKMCRVFGIRLTDFFQRAEDRERTADGMG